MVAWCAGEGRLSAGGVTGSKEAYAWVRTGFVSQAEEIQQTCKGLDWHIKVQVSYFSLFHILGPMV